MMESEWTVVGILAIGIALLVAGFRLRRYQMQDYGEKDY